MGISIASRKYNSHRKNPKSNNVYLRLLVRLYKFLARRTGSAFNRAVLRRLVTPNIHRPVMSLVKVARFTKAALAKNNKLIVVVVGDVTDDYRAQVPAGLQLCALRVSEPLRAKITAAGGKVLTFDQLALLSPRGANTILIRGKKTARVANKYFGLPPGAKGSHTRPRVISKGRKCETARGRA